MNWQLQNDRNQPVNIGASLTTFRGEQCILTGGKPPQQSGSTGRIYVDLNGHTREFFPSVCNLQWVEA